MRFSLSPVGILSSGRKELRFRRRSWQVNVRGRAPIDTILFIPLSVPPHKLETDWAASCADAILRQCPVCEHGSIIGHGRRRKQAHDEHHDWIGVRRGRCSGCGKTFTFLSWLSLPYTHYSVLARCQALRRRFVEHYSWEQATPTLKDRTACPIPPRSAVGRVAWTVPNRGFLFSARRSTASLTG